MVDARCKDANQSVDRGMCVYGTATAAGEYRCLCTVCWKKENENTMTLGISSSFDLWSDVREKKWYDSYTLIDCTPQRLNFHLYGLYQNYTAPFLRKKMEEKQVSCEVVTARRWLIPG